MSTLDFTAVPFFDNHCHPLSPAQATMDADALAGLFYHGLGDQPGDQRATPELLFHLRNMGVVQTMVCQLSKLFDCPADLETVAAERNRRTSASFADYVKMLYQDGGIVATVLDAGLPINDPLLDLIPGKHLRLFQMGPAMDAMLQQSTSYHEMLQGYQDALDRAIRQDKFVGVKAHLAEEVGFGVEPVWAEEAEAAFSAAKAGDSAAYQELYVAIFTATLLQCQDLHVPVHVHSGCTGGLWDGLISDADPLLLLPFIKQPKFRESRIVFLHAGYPWIQNAAVAAHALPHVWVDMGWVTPWISLRLTECYRDVIGMAPLSKIMIGSGGHGSAEMAWLAAKTSKIALAKVLGDAVRLSLMTAQQAERAGRLILHDNAARLYGLE